MSYADNMYKKWLNNQTAWSKQFQCSGIYAIVLDDKKIVYVGKSQNILKRMSEHKVDMLIPEGKEYKYRVMNTLEKGGHRLRFKVLAREDDPEKLGALEGEYIRKLNPPLNTAIPHEDNWREWDVNAYALEITAEDILNDCR